MGRMFRTLVLHCKNASYIGVRRLLMSVVTYRDVENA